MSIGEEQGESVGKALLDLGLGRVIVRRTTVVPIGCNVLKPRIRLEKLRLTYRLASDWAGCRQLPVVGI